MSNFLKSLIYGIVFFLSVSTSLYSLEFSIMNKGETIFQEIYIETSEEQNNYYYNFGVLGLEPGARHSVSIYCEDDILFCTFYFNGISQESYIIENVAIEQNSVVYILPEHYREFPDDYSDLIDPDAVYGVQQIEGHKNFPDLINEDARDLQNLIDLEVFNYTNSPIFRVYLDSEKFTGTENLLSSDVLLPSESITLHLPLVEKESYSLHLAGGEGDKFTKSLKLPLESDFLVFYDSDNLAMSQPQVINLINMMDEKIVEIYLIDQVSSKKQELLHGVNLNPGGTREILILENYGVCDIVARTASKHKIYIFDHDIKTVPEIPISDF